MAENRESRGVPLPSLWQVVVIAAALVGAWLVWSKYGRVIDDSDDGLFTGSPVKGLHAVETHLKLGDAAIPGLLAALDSADPRERSQAAYGLGRIGPAADEALEKLRERLADENPLVRSYAAYALAHIEFDKKSAAAYIAPLLADSQQSVREDVGKELLGIGPPALSPILAMLRNEQAAVRLNVVLVLKGTNTRSWAGQHAEILQAVHEALKDPDPGVRAEALTVLAEWDQATPAEVGELLRNDDDRRVVLALNAVTRMKQEASVLLPDIIVLFERFNLDDVNSARGRGLDGRLQAILAALTSLKRAALPAAPRLLQLSAKCNLRSRIPIAQTLADIGADPADIVGVLSPLLLEDRLAFQAGELIVTVSPAGARRQVSLLIPKLVRADGTVDKSVLYALHGLGHEAHEAVPALIPLLQNSDSKVAEFAAHTLNRTGLAGIKAVPDLARVVGNDTMPTLQRVACVNALASMGASAQSTVPGLLKVISQPEPTAPPPITLRNDSEWRLRTAIILALGQMAGNDAGLVPALRSQLSSRSHHVRAAAAEALGRAAGQSSDVLAELIRRLRDDFPIVRAQAALAIGRMTVDRSTASAPLTMMLADEHPEVRTAAALALGRIGAAAREALPMLRKILADPRDSGATSVSLPLEIPELNSLSFERAVREAIKAIEGKSKKDVP